MPSVSSAASCGFCHELTDGTVIECAERGEHFCEPRARRVVDFFAEVLVHTKGDWARRAFVLEPWQEHEIIRPLFGLVVWSEEWARYVRRYRIAYIVLARKNGKTELAAGIVLYLLVADDEEAAEVYGAAKDTKQAGKVAMVVERMRQLSPVLRRRLDYRKNDRRIFDERTASFYEVVTSDAAGELGHNPHGIVIDELLSQADASLWNALRTSMGARSQPLMVAITTETDDPSSFCAVQIDEAERIAADPQRAPHVFTYIRKLPADADVWDEANWPWPNPALGSFLSAQSLRDEALEARNDPTKENSFRQFRANQRVQQTTRFMPLHLWDASAGIVIEDDLAGTPCFGGLDLASTTDLAAWVLWFPATGDVLWRFWVPGGQLAHLSKRTGGQAEIWVREGLLRRTEGDWIDYENIHRVIETDHGNFAIRGVGADPAGATSTVQFMQGLGLDVEHIYQGFTLSPAIKEIMRLVGMKALHHGGHPVARWNADSVEVKRDEQDRLKLVKPERAASGKRIDGFAALANAIRKDQLTEKLVASQSAEAFGF